MQPFLLTSFTVGDPTFIGLQSAIAAFIPTMVSWSGGGFVATVVTTPSPALLVPAYFTPVIASSLLKSPPDQSSEGVSDQELEDFRNGTNSEVAELLASLIYAAFSSSFTAGTAINPGGFIAPITGYPII